MPAGLTPDELAQVSAIASSTRTVRQGTRLYAAGDPFQSIYAIRTGSFKTVLVHRDGQPQVTNFYFSGYTLGLDAIGDGSYRCDAIALEDSVVCILPFRELNAVGQGSGEIQRHLMRLMSSEMARRGDMQVVLGMMSAGQRVATFLLNQSKWMRVRGYSNAEFVLRMSRTEIASHLGIKIETVSRMLRKFGEAHLIEHHGRHIRILDLDGLARVES